MSNELTKQEARPATLVEIRLDTRRFPRLCKMKRAEIVEGLKKIVYMAMMYRNQAAGPEQLDFTAAALCDALLEDNDFGTKWLSLEEVARVAKRAALDPATFGISVTSLYGAVCHYCQTDGTQADRKARSIREQNTQALIYEADRKKAAAMAAAAVERMTKNITLRKI